MRWPSPRAISDFVIRDDLECTVGFELIDKGIKMMTQLRAAGIQCNELKS